MIHNGVPETGHPVFLKAEISMIDCEHIIDQYYPQGSDIRPVLVTHSRQVAQLAVKLAMRQRQNGVEVDIDFVREAAMLHDIGIFLTDAPGIHCHGTEPYIKHGVLGSELISALGLPLHALVCERHTGSGISVDDILRQQLPLPHRPMLPVTIEEKIICYADKFFSKTHLGEPARSVERVRHSLAKFGPEAIGRFNDMEQLFGLP